jgi:hypothetical protein
MQAKALLRAELFQYLNLILLCIVYYFLYILLPYILLSLT